MKKILHIISQYPGKTGSGIYLQALIKEGEKRGHTQGLIAAISKGHSIHMENVKSFYPIVFNTEELPFNIVGMSDAMPYNSTKYRDMTKNMLEQWKKELKKP